MSSLLRTSEGDKSHAGLQNDISRCPRSQSSPLAGLLEASLDQVARSLDKGPLLAGAEGPQPAEAVTMMALANHLTLKTSWQLLVERCS